MTVPMKAHKPTHPESTVPGCGSPGPCPPGSGGGGAVRGPTAPRGLADRIEDFGSHETQWPPACRRPDGGGIGLADVIRRGAGNAVVERPAVHRRDLPRPVAVGRRRRGRPFEAVRVPGVLARLRALECTPEVVDEEQDLGGTQHEGAHRDELVHRLQALQEVVLIGVVDPTHLAGILA